MASGRTSLLKLKISKRADDTQQSTFEATVRNQMYTRPAAIQKLQCGLRPR